MKKYDRVIPGHVQAITWMLALASLVGAWIGMKTRTGPSEMLVLVGALLLPFCGYLAAQATHLAQEDHKDSPGSWLEDMQQRHRGIFVVLGVLGVGISAFLIAKF